MTDRLGDERRAIGTRIERERRSYDNTTARRAINQRMENERRGAAVQDDLNSLVRPERKRQTLPPVAPRGALPAQRGRADYKAPAAAGGGIASPVNEPSYAAREWWPGGIPSTDGLLMLPAEKKIVMRDANNAEVIFQYAEPSV